ncbi:MAG: Gfo/Idh/MocA family oxidoreductase [Phycisphaerales bacterium]|nr:Gfo/Idh/MocA family oxidoreductase [Phycisphaerales bacterium]
MSPPVHPPVGIGVIGLGFMGRVHINAYRAASEAGHACRLLAVCDPDPQRRTGRAASGGNIGAQGPEQIFDPAAVDAHADPDDLLRDPRIRLVSICTYTESHVDLALRALAAGKHVLVEKPVSLRVPEVKRLAAAARAADTLCMPAMCMRFWPAWDWLNQRIGDGSLGRLRSATFQRMGSGPSWSAEFYRDAARSGGAFFDLHIHDADFIYWCFGKPRAVTTTGTHQHLTTLYHYGDAPSHIIAEGAWDLAPSSGFRMRYLVNFERATAEFDLTHPTPVRLHRESGTEAVDVGPLTGYDGEIRHLVSVIGAGSRDIRATMDDAVAVAEMLDAEQRSMQMGRTVEL